MKKFLSMLLVCGVLLAGMTMTVGCGDTKPTPPVKPADKDKAPDKKEKDK